MNILTAFTAAQTYRFDQTFTLCFIGRQTEMDGTSQRRRLAFDFCLGSVLLHLFVYCLICFVCCVCQVERDESSLCSLLHVCSGLFSFYALSSHFSFSFFAASAGIAGLFTLNWCSGGEIGVTDLHCWSKSVTERCQGVGIHHLFTIKTIIVSAGRYRILNV